MFLPDGHFLIVLLLLLCGTVLSVMSKKLTKPAGSGALIVGMLVYTGGGYVSLVMLAVFFILATLATSHKKVLKAQITAQYRHPEKRKLSQVLANGGIPAVLGLLACFFPDQKELYGLMIAAAISAATADTLASELGMVYGRNSFNILTWKKEAPGLDGVISIEGTMLGLVGSIIIASVFAISGGSILQTGIIIVAGTIGNLADSIMGAVWERKHYLNNDAVNTLNTLIAALFALLAFAAFY